MDDNWNPVDKKHLERCYVEYREVIEFFADLERGIMIMTIADYRTMPAATLDAYRIFKSAVAEHRESKKPPPIGLN